MIINFGTEAQRNGQTVNAETGQGRPGKTGAKTQVKQTLKANGPK
jgi:hypothetical protein